MFVLPINLIWLLLAYLFDAFELNLFGKQRNPVDFLFFSFWFFFFVLFVILGYFRLGWLDGMAESNFIGGLKILRWLKAWESKGGWTCSIVLFLFLNQFICGFRFNLYDLQLEFLQKLQFMKHFGSPNS